MFRTLQLSLLIQQTGNENVTVYKLVKCTMYYTKCTYTVQVLYHHEHEIVCLTYARDDRFLVSVGDYRECSVVVWCARDMVVLAASYARQPVHDVMWDPYTANEFASVGQDGSVLFWLLDETGEKLTLNVRFSKAIFGVKRDSKCKVMLMYILCNCQ